jgi:Ca2+:H+ antiporter
MKIQLRYLLLAIVPVTIAAHYLAPDRYTLVFALALASMIPLARLLSDSTEELAGHCGSTIGALLNVTFGNAGELVIGFFAMRQGLQDVVKASITGSILVNLLLSLGASMVAGGMRHKTLTFNPFAARSRSTMLALAAISLVFPAAYRWLAGPRALEHEADLSLEFSVILLITYALGLLFSLHTHRQLLAPENAPEEDHPKWSVRTSLLLLAASAALIGWTGEILVGSLEATAHRFGLSDLFVGLVIVAIAGNAAEATSAVRAAMRNRMDLSVGIAIGSSIQVALFVAPALGVASHWLAPRPVDLVFTPIELLALVVAIGMTMQIAGDGESNWLEGAQLIVVYLLLAVTVYTMG